MMEVELKLLLPDAEAARVLLAAPALRARAAGPARRRRLRSIYFDTAEGGLRALGIALRVRKVGRVWVQTVKRAPRRAGGGLFAVEEAEAPVPGGRPDPARIAPEALRAAVEAAVDGAVLAPVFETDILRTLRDLTLDGAQVELAVDAGELIAGPRRAPLWEAEFELKSGPASALFALAREAAGQGGWRFSARSKAARAQVLAEGGDPVPAPAPRKARSVSLDRATTAEAAAVAVLRECLDQIDANMAACLASEAAEAPHQLRIGLRRLRSAFGLFGAALGGAAAEGLNARARDLAARVGRLRDLDVQIAETLGPAEGPDAAGRAALTAALEARRREVRAEVRAALAGAEGRLFLLDLAAFTELRGWLDPADHGQTAALARPSAEVAAEALDRRWRKVRRAAEGLAEADDAARHALRKELKKLRYGVEFFAPLHPGRRVKPFLKRLRVLQEAFGALNDAAVAEATFAGPDAPCPDDPEAQRAAGRLLGARAERARAERALAEAGWAALRARGPFWR